VFKVTFAGSAVNLAITGGGQAACAAFSAQASAQASNGGGLAAGTTIVPGDLSAATGTPACTKDVGAIHFTVYTDAGNTAAAQMFCAASSSSSR
jgi:hypothetical protein